MGFFNQLLLLLWKNFILRKRQKIRLVCEVLFPLALFLILLIVRVTKPDLKVKHGECHFDGKAMPSAGILPFIQSFVCTFNNTCYEKPTGDELSGVAGSFNAAGLPQLIEDIEEILSNNIDVELISDVLYDANILAELYPLLRDGNTTGNISLGNSFIDPAVLRQQILDQNLPLNSSVIDWLLSATLDTNQIFQSDVDQQFLIEIIDSFLPDIFVSQDHLEDHIRQEICDEQRLKEIFVFPNDSVSDEVHRELCALSPENFTTLYNDLRQDFDLTALENDVRNFIQVNLGRDVTFTLLTQVYQLYNDLQSDTEWQRPFRDLYDTIRQIQSQLNESLPDTVAQAQTQSTSMFMTLGTLVCGRQGAFLSIDENQREQALDADRQPVNSDLPKTTTPAPTTTTTEDPNRLSDRAKDKECTRNTSHECKALFDSLNKGGSATRFLWRQIKPFIRGCILYYPQNNVTEEIVYNAQNFFRELQQLGNLSDSWADFSPQLYNVLNNSDAVQGARYLVDSGLCTLAESVVIQRLFPNTTNNNTVDACDFLKQFLNNGPNTTDYDWRDSVEMLDSLFEMVSNYTDCFNFDKFVGYTNREEMMNDGIHMIDDDLFWAAIEFENSDWSALPTHVTYKIRMDVDKVDSTKRVKDKYPKPGPRRLPWYLKYFMYGFVYIQDMLDHALIQMQTGLRDTKPGVGIYTQQFPYPCYTEDKYYRPRPRRRPIPDLKYFMYGFVYIQDMLDHAIIGQQTGIGADKPGVGIYTQQTPFPCYLEDKFIYAISRMLPLFMILAWILTTAMLCKSIVFEKERRLKEVMKIMGLGNGVHWMAWFINAFVMMFATTLLLVIVLKAGTILEYSDPSAVLFFMTLFAIATIVKCFLISVFFSRANLAACCTGFIYFLLYLPYMLLLQFDDVLTKDVKKAVALSSNVAFGYGCNFIALWEEQAIGLQWNNMSQSPVTDDNFNMLDCIQMMIVDTILYAIFTWYIEAVFPGQYGIPKPFYFPFTRSYWCGYKYRGDGNTLPDSGMELNGEVKDNIEPVPSSRKVGVAVRNLKKMYSGTKKLAVDGLSINFYEDQITSFLGHNGAGKTTTMSILTGLFPPTEGTAYIQGEDIQTNMDQIRNSLGMCPQHNVLFDHLTVEEHMWFYARLKGSTSEQVKVEMEQMLKDVGLPHKRNDLSINLSGGMKRKLSVAIAFVGNSQTVILDEPTAGVDPYARRAIWQLLLKLKKNRTIILSTHHMDEADVLGDRIAIISLGKLCCVGSSLFLKNRYGNGYYLTVVRSDGDIDEEEILKSQMMEMTRPMSAGSTRTITSVVPTFDNEDEGYADGKSDSDPPTPPSEESYPGFSVKKVTSFVQKFVTNARLVEDNMAELCYQLPDEAAKSGDFEKLFYELEQCHKDLGISSFGISDTSLEEVFLKVAEENKDFEPSDETKRNKLDEMADGGRMPRSVSRLSFRKKKKLSLFGRRRSGRVNSKTDLMEEEDTDSVISAPVSDYVENGFSHSTHQMVTGWKLILRQFIAIFLKRFHHMRRSKKGMLVEIVLPVLFVLLSMIFTLLTPPFSEEPPLELHPWHYEPVRGDKHLYMFYSNDKENSTMTQAFERTLQEKYGVGNRCVNKHTIEDYECEPVPPQVFPKMGPVVDNIECDCSTGWQVCPDGAGGPAPPQVTLATTDYLQNMTDRDISTYLRKTWKPYQKRRYGGLSFGDVGSNFTITNASVPYDALERILTAANNGTAVNVGNITFLEDLITLLPNLATPDAAKVWFNNRGWAASVSYINVMNNLILRSNLPSGVDPADYGITAINHPMAMTKSQLNDEALYNSFKDIVIAICVMFAMSFIPASFTMYLIEERTSNSKHLQFVSGVNPLVYWFSNFFWDMLNFLGPAILCIFIFLIFNKRAYVSETNLPVLVCLLLLYGWAMIPMMYPFSRLFSIPSTALVTLQSVNIFLGTVSTMATFILEFLEEDDEGLKDINKILKQVFLLMPQYCLGRGLFDMAKNQLFADVYARFEGGVNRLPNPFDWNQVGRNLFCMFMLGILFFVLNLLFEYNIIKTRTLKPKAELLEDEDEDVAKERKRVMEGNADDDVLLLKELTKVYKSKGRKGNLTAVDRLCVGVPKGQCFGLLGVNGAGKTSTFKMLTGDEKLNKGNAFVNGHNILNEMVQVRRSIGYCPQFDALDPLLTGVEHLRFYARLRGIPEEDVKNVADWAIRRLGLLPHADKISIAYSGGNKRKLSTAIALIGNPSIIFLDEPTTGMDPGARRFLWDCVNNIVKDGRSVILTSHSMEECEALCGRLAIMVSGRFKCIGSIQHLKNRFGDGYTVIVRVSGEFPDMDPAMEFFRREFPDSVLKEKHHNMLQYQLGSDVRLSRVFGLIEAVRDRLKIEDYSVSQTTLDQVFINFAKLQTDMFDDEMEDDLPDDLKYIAKSSPPSEYESQSLASSTAGLIRNEYRRSGGARKFVDDDDSLHLTNIHRDQMLSKPVLARGDSGEAPIISLPVQFEEDKESQEEDITDMRSEVSSMSERKRGRPVTKFDDDDFNSGLPHPVA